MKSKAFKESDIEFNFGADWTVKKYDEHAYFKTLSGHGLKGVDFIGIYKNKSLFLIEVKNYRKRAYSPVDPDWSDIDGENPILASKMYGKIKDSLRLIKAVNAYLKKQWWYAPSSWIRKITGSNQIKKDFHFWNRAGLLLEAGESVSPVLCLTWSPDFLQASNQTEQQLIQKLKNGYASNKELPVASLQVISIEKGLTKQILKDVEISF